MRSDFVWSAAGVVATVLGGVVLGVADRAPQTKPTPARARAAAATDAAAPGTAGMRVAIDPETGELGVPSPQQHKALGLELQEALSRSSEGLRREVLPGGAVKVNLQGRFQNASIAVIDADGNLHTRCVENPAGAQAALHDKQCSHTTLEEK